MAWLTIVCSAISNAKRVGSGGIQSESQNVYGLFRMAHADRGRRYVVELDRRSGTPASHLAFELDVII
jgi:hypothetical protein